MAGIEVHIPYVNFKTKVQGFPRRVNAPATELTIQEHLQYYSNKVMLKTSLEPLNTTDNQVDWEILDGSTYCSIDGSTGELTIDSSTITQMVKVRAKSRANANLYEDKEIVLTHRDVEGIEQMQLQILFEDLASSYTYANDSRVYSFYVKVQPNVDITMGYDILEGTEDIEITNIQPITSGTHKDQVLIQFKLLGTHTNSDVKIRFYDTDYPADLYADAEFTAYAPISSISVSGLSEYSDQDQTAHYFWGNEYSFSYSTSPSVKRNLVVECTQNNDKISVWNLPNGNLSSGTIGFTSLTTDSNTVYTVKISDPDDENVYKEVTFLINTPVISDIVVTGNTGRYAYNSDENVYNTIGFYADPSIHRPLRLNFVEGNDLISWDVSNRLEDSGDLVFRVLDPSREGITRFLLQDSLYADSSKYVQFGVYTPITSILFNDVQDRYVHDASNTAYSFGYYALPNVPRHLDVSVLSGADNISWNLTNVVDSSGQFNFNLLGAVAEGNVSLRVSDPYDDSVYADTSFVFYSPISSIDVSGLQDHYICNEDNTTWYEIEVNTTPHVVRNLNISFSGVNWVKENENGSYTKIKFQCIDGSQGQKTLTISDPYWTVNEYTANTMFYEIFKPNSFIVEEINPYAQNVKYTDTSLVTDIEGNKLWTKHYNIVNPNFDGFSSNPTAYIWICKFLPGFNNILSRLDVSYNSDELYVYGPYNSNRYDIRLLGNSLDTSTTFSFVDSITGEHKDYELTLCSPMLDVSIFREIKDKDGTHIVDASIKYRSDTSTNYINPSGNYSFKYRSKAPVSRQLTEILTGDTYMINYDTSIKRLYNGLLTDYTFNFSIKDEYRFMDPQLHLKVVDPCDPSVYDELSFRFYYPTRSLILEDAKDDVIDPSACVSMYRRPANASTYDINKYSDGGVIYSNQVKYFTFSTEPLVGRDMIINVERYTDNVKVEDIPYTIEDRYMSSGVIKFTVGDWDMDMIKITLKDPYVTSVYISGEGYHTAPYPTSIQYKYKVLTKITDYNIYDKTSGTRQPIADIYDPFDRPNTIGTSIIPIKTITYEIEPITENNGTLSQNRLVNTAGDIGSTTVNSQRNINDILTIDASMSYTGALLPDEQIGIPDDFVWDVCINDQVPLFVYWNPNEENNKFIGQIFDDPSIKDYWGGISVQTQQTKLNNIWVDSSPCKVIRKMSNIANEIVIKDRNSNTIYNSGDEIIINVNENGFYKDVDLNIIYRTSPLYRYTGYKNNNNNYITMNYEDLCQYQYKLPNLIPPQAPFDHYEIGNVKYYTKLPPFYFIQTELINSGDYDQYEPKWITHPHFVNIRNGSNIDHYNLSYYAIDFNEGYRPFIEYDLQRYTYDSTIKRSIPLIQNPEVTGVPTFSRVDNNTLRLHLVFDSSTYNDNWAGGYGTEDIPIPGYETLNNLTFNVKFGDPINFVNHKYNYNEMIEIKFKFVYNNN